MRYQRRYTPLQRKRASDETKPVRSSAVQFASDGGWRIPSRWVSREVAEGSRWYCIALMGGKWYACVYEVIYSRDYGEKMVDGYMY